MKKTVHFLLGNAYRSILLSAFFFFAGAATTSAQQSAQGTLNPYTHIATKLDVTAYALGTFERTHTIDVLEQILAGLKPLLSNGGGSESQRLKYDYVNRVIADVSSQYVAVEIALLTSLSALTAHTSSTDIQPSELRALYTEVVNQID